MVIEKIEEDEAVKMFNACPHCEALELGATPKIKAFCRDMLGKCDYAICAPFQNVKIDFPQLSETAKVNPAQ